MIRWFGLRMLCYVTPKDIWACQPRRRQVGASPTRRGACVDLGKVPARNCATTALSRARFELPWETSSTSDRSGNSRSFHDEPAQGPHRSRILLDAAKFC